MITLALSDALVAAVSRVFSHGHTVATRSITAELREIAAAEEADRPPRCDPD